MEAGRRRIRRAQGLQAEVGDPAAAGSLVAELQEVVEARSWEPGPAGECPVLLVARSLSVQALARASCCSIHGSLQLYPELQSGLILVNAGSRNYASDPC